MIAFLNKFFVDKFFILYFYISSSVTYDFYITIFLNLIAIFYFLLMLYVLNFIAFLRNNFFNDLRVTKLIGYLLGLSLKHDPERFKQIMGALAYYGYTVLTVLEVSIKSSFLVIIGYFVTKAPFISLDPSPISSWKFADLFSKSRFYSYRPWTSSPSRSYRGFSSGNFAGEGVWFGDDTDNVEAFDSRYLPYSKDFDHEDIFLRPGGIGLRLRTRARALSKFSVIGTISSNWTRHLLGSRRDMGSINKVSAPRHRLERTKLYFSRNKSLELKSPIHMPFSYYRSEDDCYPISTKGGFLSRLYVPGFGSKARKHLMHVKSAIPRYNDPANNRQKYSISAFATINHVLETEPYFKAREQEKIEVDKNTNMPVEKDLYRDYRDRDFEKTAEVLQSKWLDYVERVDSLNVKDPANYLSPKRFNQSYSKLKNLIEERSRGANGYELPNKEPRVLNDEERSLITYFRYLTNDPSDVEKGSMNSRYTLLLNRNTPFRPLIIDKEASPLYTHTFDNKFSSIHNLRGRHVYRRSLFDFVNIRVLEYLRSFSDFFGFNIESSNKAPTNSALDSNSHEELFGFMINDREKFYKKVFKQGTVDEDNRPAQFRGRESLDLNYATAGSVFRYFFDSSLPAAKERVFGNSFVGKDADDHESESLLFDDASDDRIRVNMGVYVHKKLRAKDSWIDRKDFYNIGNIGFLNQYGRMVYQFVLDHFTYWLRIIASFAGYNYYVPHFPNPVSRIADKPTGLNPYVIFFKTFYFFRKCFRVILFGFLSDRGVSGTKVSCGLESSSESYSFSETSDFTLLALRKTLFSYFARLVSLSFILALNGFLVGSSAVLNFTLNHTTASVFIILLAAVSMFRIRYSYEFDFNRIFFKSKSPSFTTRLFGFLARAVRLIKAPFSIITKSIGVLIRFFSTSNMQPPRKPKESTESYHAQLIKEQEVVANVLSFFRVDKIRKILNRFGILRSRNKADFEGYNKSIFEIIWPKSLSKRGSAAYREISSLRSRLALRIEKWFNFSRRADKPVVAYKRLHDLFLLRRIKAKFIRVKVKKEKTVYFSFEPTPEFLRAKHSVMTAVNSLQTLILQIKELAKRNRGFREGLSGSQQKSKKGLKNNIRKVAESVTRASGNAVSSIKWKLTEWINKQ